MKKKIFIGGIAILGIATTVAFNVNIDTEKNVMSSLNLSNIEALAQENGTPAGRCYIIQYFTTNDWKLFCNTDTDDNEIYPCPTSTSWHGFSESAKDRCTK